MDDRYLVRPSSESRVSQRFESSPSRSLSHPWRIEEDGLDSFTVFNPQRHGFHSLNGGCLLSTGYYVLLQKGHKEHRDHVSVVLDVFFSGLVPQRLCSREVDVGLDSQ